MLTLIVLEGLAIVLLAVLVIGLLRSHAEILRRLHELGAGIFDEDPRPADGVTTAVELSRPPDIRTQPGVAEPRPIATQTTRAAAVAQAVAHDIVGTTPSGGAIAAGVLGTGHTTLIAFLTSGCATCQNFWQAFGAGEAAALPGRDTRLVIVTAGPDRESPASVQAVAPHGLTTVMSSQAWEDYGVPVSPYFILVDGPSSRVIGEGAAATWGQVFELLTKAVADAGIDAEGRAVVTPRPQGRLSGAERSARAQDDLAAAGIEAGHPSLYPDAVFPDERPSDHAQGSV